MQQDLIGEETILDSVLRDSMRIKDASVTPDDTIKTTLSKADTKTEDSTNQANTNQANDNTWNEGTLIQNK